MESDPADRIVRRLLPYKNLKNLSLSYNIIKCRDARLVRPF